MTHRQNTIRRILLGAGAGAMLATAGFPALAEDGVTDKEIRIGMANALSGPASGLGVDLKAGADAFLARVNAAVLVEALKKAGANPTRAGFVSALEGLNNDLGGLKVAFSATSHQDAKDVFLTVVRGGKAVQVDKL